MHNSLAFGLELGITTNGRMRWKTLTTMTVLNIEVPYKAVLVEVVNMSNHTLGLIIIRISDQMMLFHKRLMKNYDSIPKFLQVLMHDTYEKCDTNIGNFIECTKAVELYIKNAHTLYITKLTSAFNTIFVKMRQNAHFETTSANKNSKIVVEAKGKT